MNVSNPRVVAIGGGHGLSVTLQAATTYADTLTAIVSVADDGGSSGRLRETTGLPAMGDIRRCLSSLAEPAALGQMFEHRFDAELAGHALGNLMIAALAQRIGFRAAIDELARLLSVPARILPATEVPVDLVAVTERGTVHGQVAVQDSTDIRGVALDPPDPPAEPDAVDAIACADQIVIGPGSLYTSVLAALAVPGIRAAVNESEARIVYVCNLQAQEPETANYATSTYVDALRAHGVDPDVVIDEPTLAAAGGRLHDPKLLAPVLAETLGEPRRPR
ncbi:MAG TPA: gluconeogenesis factor YvcK family protein [Acidimicrobiales bacterium]|nr:gluconeogenesis factor YvcK family protein [Acidimicrobiales bacterium]